MTEKNENENVELTIVQKFLYAAMACVAASFAGGYGCYATKEAMAGWFGAFSVVSGLGAVVCFVFTIIAVMGQSDGR